MRTILPFMFAAWIVMPTLSCVQVGKDSTLPAQLAPGVSQKPVLEASLGTAPPVGWKWRVQERTRPKGGDVTRHTDSALYYTLEETHELVRGDTVETSPEVKQFLSLLGWSIYIGCCLSVLRCVHLKSTSLREMAPGLARQQTSGLSTFPRRRWR